MKIKRAIVSVSDKTDIVEFVKELSDLGIEILSTGGTAKILKENGINVIEISSYTGFPEIMDGRVKTLHPKIHGGILALRDNEEHIKTMEKLGIKPIDMVVVNLYPFEKTVEKSNVTFEEAIENIDIGGPTMIRAAAKNFKFVVVIIDPEDYKKVLEELKVNGDVSYSTRLYLAQKVFERMSKYDYAIAKYLREVKNEIFSKR